jgi:TPR repeat protein
MPLRTTLLSALVLGLLIPGPAWAKKKKKWEVTRQNFAEVKKKAEAGDGYSQALVCMVYIYEEFEFKTRHKAKEWCSREAARKNPLGKHLYLRDTAKNSDKRYKGTIRGLARLAKRGDPRAQFLLGQAYRMERGVKNDPKKFYELVLTAANQDYPVAQWWVGFAHQADSAKFGVKPDPYNLAGPGMMYYEKSARNGYKQAARQMAGYYYHGTRKVRKSKHLAYKYWAQAENESDLYKMYDYGDLDRKQSLKLIKLLEKRDRGGDTYAPIKLAQIYLKGKSGIKKNCELALKWLSQAANKGTGDSPKELGHLYGVGTCVKRNVALSMRWKLGMRVPKSTRNTMDKISGLGYFLAAKWQDDAHTQPEADALMATVLRAYRSKLPEIGRDSFKEGLATQAGAVYRNETWFMLWDERLPHVFASEILLAVKADEEKNPGFWLDYAHNAMLAGQPGLVLLAVHHLEQMPAAKDKERAQKIKQLSVVLKAAAYVAMGKQKDASKVLFKNGTFTKDQKSIAHYINKWAKPLLKDRTQLSALTGIPSSSLDRDFKLYKSQPFHNIASGKLVGAGAAPKLNKPAATRRPRKPAAKSQPAVEILE